MLGSKPEIGFVAVEDDDLFCGLTGEAQAEDTREECFCFNWDNC